MSLTLYYHPLSSFCWKALIALYETGTPFQPLHVDLGDPTSRAAFLKVWPIGNFPVLRDEASGETIPESTIIIEYLTQHYPGGVELVPADPEAAREVRLCDRVYDLYVHQPMQRIVGDRIRPAGSKDPYGVEESRRLLRTALDMLEPQTGAHTFAAGESFSLADCAAAPALYYANKVMPFAETHPNLTKYLDRLMRRPSFARVLEEAQPYFKYFPQ